MATRQPGRSWIRRGSPTSFPRRRRASRLGPPPIRSLPSPSGGKWEKAPVIYPGQGTEEFAPLPSMSPSEAQRWVVSLGGRRLPERDAHERPATEDQVLALLRQFVFGGGR